MAVKRKAPSSATAASTTQAQPSATLNLSPSVLETRLLSGLGSSNKTAKGSLSAVASHTQQYLSDPSHKDVLLRETRLLQLETKKLQNRLAGKRSQIERIQAATRDLKQETDTLAKHVASQRQELAQQLQVTACEREYEALAKLVTTQHPTAGRVLQEQLEGVVKQIASAKEELEQKNGEVQVRKSQFQLIVQSILDMKQSLQEPTLDLTDEKPEEVELEEGEEANDPMQMDEEKNEKEGEDDLYSGI